MLVDCIRLVPIPLLTISGVALQVGNDYLCKRCRLQDSTNGRLGIVLEWTAHMDATTLGACGFGRICD